MFRMSMVWKKVLTIAGILLILDGVFMACASNFNFGTIAILGLGIFLTTFDAVFRYMDKNLNKKITTVIRYMILVGLVFMAAVISMIALVGERDTATFNEDAVIVLGAGIKGERVTLPLMHRLDKAVEYWHKNTEAIIVVSGGQGLQESISEALAMKKYLIAKNIPEEKIIMEDQSTSTYENFAFSKKILTQLLGDHFTVTYITNRFHMYRAGQIAQAVGINGTSYGAPIAWYLLPNVYLREFFAVIKFWILKV